jgi:hypothetical protein
LCKFHFTGSYGETKPKKKKKKKKKKKPWRQNGEPIEWNSSTQTFIHCNSGADQRCVFVIVVVADEQRFLEIIVARHRWRSLTSLKKNKTKEKKKKGSILIEKSICSPHHSEHARGRRAEAMRRDARLCGRRSDRFALAKRRPSRRS